jgi:hypothetical protein
MKNTDFFPKKTFRFIAVGLAALFLTPCYAYNGANHRLAVSEGLKSANFDSQTMSNLDISLMKPDSDQWYNLAAHCDGGDYLDKEDNGGETYPISRSAANEYYNKCARDMVHYLNEAVNAADKLVDYSAERIAVTDSSQLINSTNCTINDEWRWVKGKYNSKKVWEMGHYEASGSPQDTRAKCVVLRNFGRLLHATTDFYAHTNYADKANPSQPLGIHNPPGLNLSPQPAPLLEIYSLWKYNNTLNTQDVTKADQALKSMIEQSTNRFPAKLTSGCWVYSDEEYDSKCDNRIMENKDMQKDVVTDGRSIAAEHNFDNAFRTAVADVSRQWGTLEQALKDKYGDEKATLMIDAIRKG